MIKSPRQVDNGNNNLIIESYLEKYSVTKEAIEVNFRAKFPELNSNDRYSHLIHSYPAKLLSHIPYFFINNDLYSDVGDIILDPFCGTGTVLLEGALANRKVIGADANPLARLIAEVKTTPLQKKKLIEALSTITRKAKKYKYYEIPDVVNRNYWFSYRIQKELAKILRAIQEISDIKLRNFFLVCFSSCVKKVSYVDLRISVPVKLNPHRFAKNSAQRKSVIQRLNELKNIDVLAKFTSITEENIDRIEKLNTSIKKKNLAKIVSTDARNLTQNPSTLKKIDDQSIKMIITSPPYAGAQKYIRSSSLNLGWLGLCKTNELKKLDNENIGRENYNNTHLKEIITGIASADQLIAEIYTINPKRAVIVGNYLLEMKDALKEAVRVLANNGHLILIVGNNMVCNKEFNTQLYLSEYLERIGLKIQYKLIDDIKSYGLMTKRNKTADIISREWILVFKKEKK